MPHVGNSVPLNRGLYRHGLCRVGVSEHREPKRPCEHGITGLLLSGFPKCIGHHGTRPVIDGRFFTVHLHRGTSPLAAAAGRGSEGIAERIV